MLHFHWGRYLWDCSSLHPRAFRWIRLACFLSLGLPLFQYRSWFWPGRFPYFWVLILSLQLRRFVFPPRHLSLSLFLKLCSLFPTSFSLLMLRPALLWPYVFSGYFLRFHLVILEPRSLCWNISKSSLQLSQQFITIKQSFISSNVLSHFPFSSAVYVSSLCAISGLLSYCLVVLRGILLPRVLGVGDGILHTVLSLLEFAQVIRLFFESPWVSHQFI